MSEIYKSFLWVYKVKGMLFFRFKCVAREENVASEIVRLISKLVTNKPTKLKKKKLVYINIPPYELEQNQINKLKEECLKRRIDPNE